MAHTTDALFLLVPSSAGICGLGAIFHHMWGFQGKENLIKIPITDNLQCLFSLWARWMYEYSMLLIWHILGGNSSLVIGDIRVTLQQSCQRLAAPPATAVSTSQAPLRLTWLRLRSSVQYNPWVDCHASWDVCVLCILFHICKVSITMEECVCRGSQAPIMELDPQRGCSCGAGVVFCDVPGWTSSWTHVVAFNLRGCNPLVFVVDGLARDHSRLPVRGGSVLTIGQPLMIPRRKVYHPGSNRWVGFSRWCSLKWKPLAGELHHSMDGDYGLPAGASQLLAHLGCSWLSKVPCCNHRK